MPKVAMAVYLEEYFAAFGSYYNGRHIQQYRICLGEPSMTVCRRSRRLFQHFNLYRDRT